MLLLQCVILLIQLNSSVHVSEFDERFDVKLWAIGLSMTSDTPMAKSE